MKPHEAEQNQEFHFTEKAAPPHLFKYSKETFRCRSRPAARPRETRGRRISAGGGSADKRGGPARAAALERAYFVPHRPVRPQRHREPLFAGFGVIHERAVCEAKSPVLVDDIHDLAPVH